MKEEIYAIRRKNTGKIVNGIREDVWYTIGDKVPTHDYSWTVVKKITMAITKDRLFVEFEDGSRVVLGYTPQDVDLFYRPIKKKDVRGDKSTDNEGGA
jgi:hypothetical protein